MMGYYIQHVEVQTMLHQRFFQIEDTMVPLQMYGHVVSFYS